ncbi:MAG: hypothetical protein K0R54_268 [Clostridiaceae bacterium]|jgi:hypothetical protein|nr:hypothetical protein [Clostridiaceae bacterium]
MNENIVSKLLEDVTVSDIILNPEGEIFYEKEGKVYKYGENFKDIEEQKQVIKNVCGNDNVFINNSSIGQYINEKYRITFIQNSPEQLGFYNVVIRKYK